jgi:ferredoxin
MKIRVDANLCTGHGRCYTVAPELLSYDDEGFVTIRGSAIEVLTDQSNAAQEAMNSCPEGAITLED